MMPPYGTRDRLRRKLPRRAGAVTAPPPPFASVPRRQLLSTMRRVLLSQTPFRDPANEPLPEFANRWFARWDCGDVTRWYSAEPAG